MAVFAGVTVFAVFFIIMLCDVVCQTNRAYHIVLVTYEFIKFMDIQSLFSINYINQYLFLSENTESCEKNYFSQIENIVQSSKIC